MRDQFEGKTIELVVTGLELGDDDETAAGHPVFRRHPFSGRTALYTTMPRRCAAISGMAPAEADDTITLLFEHANKEANT